MLLYNINKKSLQRCESGVEVHSTVWYMDQMQMIKKTSFNMLYKDLKMMLRMTTINYKEYTSHEYSYASNVWIGLRDVSYPSIWIVGIGFLSYLQVFHLHQRSMKMVILKVKINKQLFMLVLWGGWSIFMLRVVGKEAAKAWIAFGFCEKLKLRQCLTWSLEQLCIGNVKVMLTGPDSLAMFPALSK